MDECGGKPLHSDRGAVNDWSTPFLRARAALDLAEQELSDYEDDGDGHNGDGHTGTDHDADTPTTVSG